MGKARKTRRRRGGPRTARIPRAAAEVLRWGRVARIATAGGSGMPHLVPVCHVLAGGKIYLGSGKRARKVLNVRANPQLALTVDYYADDWDALRGVMVQGKAAVIERGPRFRRVRRLLYRKYPQYPMEAALGESDSVMIELTPTHVFSWGLD
jgi:PPOX class probable F420-dependent enzyme